MVENFENTSIWKKWRKNIYILNSTIQKYFKKLVSFKETLKKNHLSSNRYFTSPELLVHNENSCSFTSYYPSGTRHNL